MFAEAARAQEQARRRTGGPGFVPPRQPPPVLPPLPRLLEMDVSHAIAHVLQYRRISAHYCLGLPPDAPPDDIRRQYKQLALRLHPDKSGHEQAREAFDAIHTAFNSIYRAPSAQA